LVEIGQNYRTFYVKTYVNFTAAGDKVLFSTEMVSGC